MQKSDAQPELYGVVCSTSGHDRGELYLVAGFRQGRLLLCNGRNRRIAYPKSKSPRHVRIAGGPVKAPRSDREIRKTLNLLQQAMKTAVTAAPKEDLNLGES